MKNELSKSGMGEEEILVYGYYSELTYNRFP